MSRIDQAVNIEDLRLIAKRRLPRLCYDFIEGGVEDEVGLRTNANAFCGNSATSWRNVSTARSGSPGPRCGTAATAMSPPMARTSRAPAAW